MKICCFGSLNIDMVFAVEAFVKPKETIQSRNMSLYAGGKGLNQAVALRKAGVEVMMAGSVGKDGGLLLGACDRNGIDRRMVREVPTSTGIAVIQVDSNGENCIILHDGANRKNDQPFIDQVLSSLDRGDYLVLQNEIGNLEYLIRQAKRKGMVIFFNPSPIDEAILHLPLELCDYIVLNEVEAGVLTGETESDRMLSVLLEKYHDSRVILTLGSKGVMYGYKDVMNTKPAIPVHAVDTTGAGDAFTGYLIAMLSKGADLEAAIDIAVKAAGISVTRPGSSDSIPYLAEVLKYRDADSLRER
jgi:ribokinase